MYILIHNAFNIYGAIHLQYSFNFSDFSFLTSRYLLLLFFINTGGERVKFPTTPPPRKKHQTGLQNVALLPEAYPLTKSKSHESQLANRVDGNENNLSRFEFYSFY